MIYLILVLLALPVVGVAGEPDWTMKVPKPIPGCEVYVKSDGTVTRVCDGDLTAHEQTCYAKMQEAMRMVEQVQQDGHYRIYNETGWFVTQWALDERQTHQWRETVKECVR